MSITPSTPPPPILPTQDLYGKPVPALSEQITGIKAFYRSWDDLEYAFKRTKWRQINRIRAYNDTMLGAVKL